MRLPKGFQMRMRAPMEAGICCGDIEALIEFYVEVLGFSLVNVIAVGADKAREAALSPAGYKVARLQTSWGERVKLLQPDQPPEESGLDAWILGQRNRTYLTFIVDNLEEVLARLAGRAALLTGERRVEVRPGVWLAFAQDPEGNLLEFVEYDDIAAYRSDVAEAGTGAH